MDPPPIGPEILSVKVIEKGFCRRHGFLHRNQLACDGLAVRWEWRGKVEVEILDAEDRSVLLGKVSSRGKWIVPTALFPRHPYVMVRLRALGDDCPWVESDSVLSNAGSVAEDAFRISLAMFQKRVVALVADDADGVVESKSGAELVLNVSRAGGEAVSVGCSLGDTVGDVKRRLESNLHVEAGAMILLFDGQHLEDDRGLADADVHSGTTVSVVAPSLGKVGFSGLPRGVELTEDEEGFELVLKRGILSGERQFRFRKDCRVLKLSSKKIGASGAEALSRALPSLSSLRELHLGDNNLGASGAEALSGALPSLSSLQTLEIWGNKIGNSGVEGLFSFLPSLSSLQKLHLGNNNIGSAGAKFISSVLPSLSSLLELRLEFLAEQVAKAAPPERAQSV